MGIGLVTKTENPGETHEFRDAVASAFLIGTLEVLNKLPEAAPTLGDVYSAIRLGAIAGIAFYMLNKGIQKVKKNGS